MVGMARCRKLALSRAITRPVGLDDMPLHRGFLLTGTCVRHAAGLRRLLVVGNAPASALTPSNQLSIFDCPVLLPTQPLETRSKERHQKESPCQQLP